MTLNVCLTFNYCYYIDLTCIRLSLYHVKELSWDELVQCYESGPSLHTHIGKTGLVFIVYALKRQYGSSILPRAYPFYMLYSY